MIWFAGDHGLKLRLSQDLPETLARFLPAAVERFLMENNLSSTEVEHWLVHPGGPQILDAVESSLSIPQLTIPAKSSGSTATCPRRLFSLF